MAYRPTGSVIQSMSVQATYLLGSDGWASHRTMEPARSAKQSLLNNNRSREDHHGGRRRTTVASKPQATSDEKHFVGTAYSQQGSFYVGLIGNAWKCGKCRKD